MTVHDLPVPGPVWGEPIRVISEVPTPLLTPERAAEALGCTVDEIGLRWERGELEEFRIGSLRRYRLVEAPSPQQPPRHVIRREYMRAFNRAWLASRRAEYFEGKACVDCGGTNDLEIHHRDPSLKVSHRIWSWSQERREAELAKCEVVCNACHKKRHAAAHGGERRWRKGCRCAECVAGHVWLNAARRARNAAKRQARHE